MALDNSNWMSFDVYKTQNPVKPAIAALALAPGADADAAVAGPQADTKVPPPDKNDQGLPDDHSATVTLPGMKPGVAPPTRPINVPVMPGVNKGYNMQVNSTEDERPPVAEITNIDTQPAVALPSRNWQTPREAQNTDGDDDAQKPLNVRMSFLPNTRIAPAPTPMKESNHGRAPAAVAALISPPAEPAKKADPAACAAIDAYKKKQLEALASDRETLADLQKAIAQLGLQKELSFITGASGKVNQADSSVNKMDMPAQAPDAAKN